MRTTRGARLTAVVVVVSLGAGGCSGDADVSVRTGDPEPGAEVDLVTDGSTTSAPEVPRPPVTRSDEQDLAGTDDDHTGPPITAAALVAPVVAVAPDATLGETLLSVGPRGWQSVAETAPDLGPLTLQEAAAGTADAEAEEALLQTRRLQSAYARRWRAPHDALATVIAYEFEDAEGALGYEVDSYLAIIGAGAAELAPHEGTRGFTAQQGTQVVHGRSLRAGERLYVVVVRGTLDDAVFADALIAAQRDRAGRS